MPVAVLGLLMAAGGSAREGRANPIEMAILHSRADVEIEIIVPVVPPTSVPLPAVPLVVAAKKYKVQKDKIYYGDADSFAKPAVISAEKVYAKIPAFQTIVEKGLTKDDPEYFPLMRKAAMAFVRALKIVCDDDGYDLVGEVGAIEGEKGEDIPDITAAAIAALGKK